MRWSETSNGERYISLITGYPPDAQRLDELVRTFEDQHIPFTEADALTTLNWLILMKQGLNPTNF